MLGHIALANVIIYLFFLNTLPLNNSPPPLPYYFFYPLIISPPFLFFFFLLQRAVDRICAVQASRVYHMMLQLPDAAGYKLFHPMIFQKSLDVFHLFPENGMSRISGGIVVSFLVQR